MNLTRFLPQIVNLADAERAAGVSLRTPEAIRAAGYRIVQARDAERCYLAKESDLQPLLVRLGDIAEVRFGIKTGANEFFYLEPVGLRVADILAGKAGQTVRVKNSAGWEEEIESIWLRPVIKSPRELKTLRVRPEDLRYLVFMPPDAIRDQLPLLAASGELKQRYPKAWAYIQWGEKQGYHRRDTCKSRSLWYDFGDRDSPDLFINKGVNNRHFVTLNSVGALADQQVYEIYINDDCSTPQEVVACLNCSLLPIFAETEGRVNFGEGVLWIAVYEATKFTLLNPAALTASQRERLLEAFDQLAEREVKSIFEELGLPKPNRDYSNIRLEDVSLERVLPDRRALDAVVFEVLGLNESEQLAVYRAVVELVKSRLVKAQSVG